tara:strand:+ start:66 stop:728 length:663 start_codon:yes stop_codon:yes gene_type:complete
MIQTKILMSNAAMSNEESILGEIHKAEKNIAIYEREIPELIPEIRELMKNTVKLELNGTLSEIKKAIITQFKDHFPTFKALPKDILELLNLFNNVAGSSTYRLLLATVNTNMCRRFHTDINDLRLLCTYSGPGTLWLTEDNINRNALDSDDEEKCIAIDQEQIQQAKTGDAIILKGAIYPKADTKAIVHRSPTIEESGKTRLLLRIDTNDFLSFLNGDDN